MYCGMVFHLMYLSFLLFFLPSGGLLQPRLSLQSPEFVSQVRHSHKCPVMCLSFYKAGWRTRLPFTLSDWYLTQTFLCYVFTLLSLLSTPPSCPFLKNLCTWRLSLLTPFVSSSSIVVQTTLSSSSLNLLKHNWIGSSETNTHTHLHTQSMVY